MSTAGCEHRREHETDDISYASGGMLIDHRTLQPTPIPTQYLPGIAHCQCQCSALLGGHAVKKHCHGKGSRLTFADGTICQSINKSPEFLPRKFLAVALSANHFLRKKDVIRHTAPRYF